MKKIYLSLALALASAPAFAQGLFMNFHSGYAFETATEIRGTYFSGLPGQQNGGSSFSNKNIYGTTGQGLHINLGVGYMLSPHFGFSLGFDGFGSSKDQNGYLYKEVEYDGDVYTYLQETKTYSRQLRVQPQMIVSAGSEGFSPYARFGLVLPVYGNTYTEVYVNDYTGEVGGQIALNSVEVNAKAQTSGSFSIGYTSAIGFQYNITPKLLLYTECELTTLTIKASKTEVIEFYAYNTFYYQDGSPVPEADLIASGLNPHSYLEDMTVSERETVYVDELTENSNYERLDIGTGEMVAGDRALPTNELAKRSNYNNSVGLNIGIKFFF